MNCLRVPEIMLPGKGVDLYQWAVVACDQYTSQPDYWEETKRIVKGQASTLNLILPEVYLGAEDEAERISNIHSAMERYLKDGILQKLPRGFMLVERSFGKEYSRWGLVAEVDLETYEYKKGTHSLIRPTEMTVEERIPPRLRVRRSAALELPHIMLLLDDPECSIIEPLAAKRQEFQQMYDTDLMQQGGHISGWLIPEGRDTERIMKKVEDLAAPETFAGKYNLEKEYPLLNLAVGDGNHSMATAKAAWEEIKQGLSKEEQENHPARFCLCELVNVHDKSLEVEPIHRVLFQVNEEQLLAEAETFYSGKGCQMRLGEPDGGEFHRFIIDSSNGRRILSVKNPVWGIGAATIQAFLDAFLAKHPECRIDYIHGADVAEQLGKKEGNLCFLLPEINKEDLFIGVIRDGVLPRKTFSMGEAREKRYYMECKKITDSGRNNCPNRE